MVEGRHQPTVFLDRDGTVSEEVGYMYDVSLYKVFPWTAQAIKRLNVHGIRVVLATNQSGVERGYFPIDMVHRVHARLNEELRKAGAHLDGVYFCPHRPDSGCDCRKPKPGMLTRARDEMGIDLDRAYMIGDRYTDVRTGHAAGTETVLVLTGDGHRERTAHEQSEIQPDHIAETLAEAVDIIVEQSSR
jgi:D-glycero-D-manno-heptose 1,7-bisphosphate phosphatase